MEQHSSHTAKKTRHVFAFGLGQDRDHAIENLGLLLASGMNMSSALGSLEEEVHSRRMKKILRLIDEAVASGMPLSVALEETGIFSSHTISLIRIGEESGNLSENLKLVAAQNAKDREFRSKVASAMFYPALVLGLTAIIGIGIAWFILPKLATVFTQLHVQLPLVTRALIAAGTFLNAYGLIAVPALFVAAALLVFFLFFFPRTKNAGQAILLHLPGLGTLLQEAELAHFGYLLGTLIRAGVPILSALDSVEKASTVSTYRKFYAHLQKSVEEGESFRKSFDSYPAIRRVLPPSFRQLVVAGEQSGNLSETLLKVGEMYEAKTDITTKNLATVLEPILLVIVWLGVVGVALAVILPIYSLIGGFNANQ